MSLQAQILHFALSLHICLFVLFKLIIYIYTHSNTKAADSEVSKECEGTLHVESFTAKQMNTDQCENWIQDLKRKDLTRPTSYC